MYQIQNTFITLLDTMLITLECVLLALQAVAAVRLALHSPSGIDSQSSNRLSKRSPVELDGDITKCYTIKFNVDGVNLNLRVDSDASNIIVPLPSSSNDVGLAIQSTPSGEPVTIKYRGKEYNGVTSTAAVTIPGTSITDINLPILAVEKLSPYLVGIGGTLKQGVFGFGHSLLSDRHSQTTAMDALYTNDVIPNNEVGIQLCPYDMLQESFINIGNTDITAKCGTDGNSVAWVQSPSNDQFSVNIKSMLVNGKKVDLPEEFQQVVENGRALYSYLRTCSTYMYLPKVVVKALIDAILDSNAITFKSILFKNKLGKKIIKRILQRNSPIPKFDFNIDWGKLPTITIVMFSQNPVTDANCNSVVTIKLGPKDYIQRVDSKNYLFTVAAGPNDNVVLGTSFMTRLILTFDRVHKRIGFGPGCGCEVMADGYPTISDHYRVLWPLTQLPEQPSTSSSDVTSTLRRSLSRFGSTLRDSIRRGTKRLKFGYKKI
ncbi:hypothetical protein BATDEDRAFT_27966 [Batrachochytrium dendrobatidis JAM81]|uniref:Peptidase A1 domain-containing protein n=1 Tax=Batrachochytrium dendrobatidis (strain JAM81 / FGSC 10211) TaxID=684364 RepID=F4PCE0_BATDJ|nr:uncharacterized protein BATDEDRAFT_27966 [Batrachochytrium dendrobatidis JAM81]EGF77144.1 hypothetical protein BATDEDRAFT_27966 [Batrachochytrium dendrobatidis JAM81]|eukprot:XP_006682211.1 hypothetical protein BATDEDRAFT_27966 [Batrachochytrium dendrobatidis JAM81]